MITGENLVSILREMERVGIVYDQLLKGQELRHTGLLCFRINRELLQRFPNSVEAIKEARNLYIKFKDEVTGIFNENNIENCYQGIYQGIIPIVVQQ